LPFGVGEVLMPMKIRIAVFWMITPYFLKGGYDRFGDKYCSSVEVEL
jgi:hypothetical protein